MLQGNILETAHPRGSGCRCQRGRDPGGTHRPTPPPSPTHVNSGRQFPVGLRSLMLERHVLSGGRPPSAPCRHGWQICNIVRWGFDSSMYDSIVVLCFALYIFCYNIHKSAYCDLKTSSNTSLRAFSRTHSSEGTRGVAPAYPPERTR